MLSPCRFTILIAGAIVLRKVSAIAIVLTITVGHATAEEPIRHVAVVSATTDDVEICTPVRSGGERCLPAREGDLLATDQIIRTGRNGLARIDYPEDIEFEEILSVSFAPQTTFHILSDKPMSQSELDAFFDEEVRQDWGVFGEFGVFLKGLARFARRTTKDWAGLGYIPRKVRDHPSWRGRNGFWVNRYTLCSIRGTEFFVKRQKSSGSGVIGVSHGQVLCSTNGDLQRIRSGQKSTFSERGVKPPEPMSANEFDKVTIKIPLPGPLENLDEIGSISVPPKCRGKHWGTVRLSGGKDTWSGTYTNGYSAKPNTKENRMGELSIQYDWRTLTGSGDWGQPYIGRRGKIEKVKIVANEKGVRFSFVYYTTIKGDQKKVINRLSDKGKVKSGFYCKY